MSVEMPQGLDELLLQCRGIILDVGPGSGELLSRFNPGQINAMYGAEPAVALHPGLIANAKKHGFGDKYRALLCGGEPGSLIPALNTSNILASSGTGGTAENGVFDEICCLRVRNSSVQSPCQAVASLQDHELGSQRSLLSHENALPTFRESADFVPPP